jgi:D-alanine-D-alanine ligase
MKDLNVKKKRIGVLMGGLSQERDISLKTGKAIAKALTAKGYRAQPIDVTHRIAETLSKEKIDCAFLALHGRFGEDGTIQGMLELMRIPYTGSGVLASALALHKVMTKRIFHYEKIPTPLFDVLHRQQIKRGPQREISLPLPVVVKPAREGSTIGISIVTKEKQLIPALKKASQYDEEILVEEFVKAEKLPSESSRISLCPLLRSPPRAVSMISTPSTRRERRNTSSLPGSRERNTSPLRI